MVSANREKLGAWLESGVEDGGTGMLFVAVRNLNGIAEDVGLLARVARRLRAEERLQGRARLPGELGRAARRLGEEARLRRGRA